MKKFVRIQSERTIMVTAGLQNMDVTNKDAHVADRLKISPMWPKTTCLIKKGAYWYPAEITLWNTVKNLAKDKILTIGEMSDTCDEDMTSLNEMKNNLNLALNEISKKEKKNKQSKDINLSDITEE